jgi:DNA mismatch repair protein MSH2
VKPHICEDGKEQVYLIESRHPLIEVQDPKNCIANDCRMVRNQSQLHIITGPNMGGKSTYIR